MQRRQISGYEGLYWIDQAGNVYSKNGKRKPSKLQTGYWAVDLYKDGKRKTCTIHRLLARSFIPNPFDFPNVNHKNGKRYDNRLSNLEWCTQQQNIRHAFDVLGYRNNFQTNHPRPSLGKFGKEHHTSKPVRQFKNGAPVALWKSGMDAVRAGFRSSKITECCQGKRKTHGGYEWKYC